MFAHLRAGWKAYLFLFLAVCIWGVNFHVVHIGLLHLPLFAFLTIRFLIAVCSYVPSLIQNWRQPLPIDTSRTLPPISQRGFYASGLAVGIALAFFYGMQSKAIQSHLTTVNAAFLTVTVVLWVPAITKIVFPRRRVLSVDVAVGIVSTVFGLVLLEGINIHRMPAGDMLALGGAIALAIELVIIGEIAPRLPKHQLLPWTAFYTGIAGTIFVFGWLIVEPTFFKEFAGAPKTPQLYQDRWVAVVAVVFSGVVATGFANFAANWANAQTYNGNPVITATHRGIMENLDAPIALLAGLMLFRWNTELKLSHFGYIPIILGVLTAELRLISMFRTGSHPDGT